MSPAAEIPNPAFPGRRGLALVLSSPSGAGKTTISRALLAAEPDLEMSVSVTTRAMRPGEINGKDYHFIDRRTFDEMVAADALLEHATVFENSYGSPRKPVEAALAAGHDVLFDIDWQGTQQIAAKMQSDLVTVFILPPSAAELKQRLTTRAADSDEVIARRMAKAASEMSHYPEYEYVVINSDLTRSIAEVQAILTAERLKRFRRPGLFDFVQGLHGDL